MGSCHCVRVFAAYMPQGTNVESDTEYSMRWLPILGVLKT